MDWVDNAMDATDTRCEAMWSHNGHVCAVYLHPHLLHRCGYVWVADKSPLDGVGYFDDRIVDVGVHGGVTFANRLRVGDIECDEPDQGGWAFGFDCGHVGDAPDVEAGIARYGDCEEYHSKRFGIMLGFVDPFTGMSPHVWTLEDVCRETERMCDQIASIERGVVASE